MIAALAGILLLTQEGNVVQAELPSGAKYRIERMDHVGVLATLYASASNLPDDGGTPGLRHLLEHLVAKGPDRRIDRQLESRGMALVAQTERDGISFTIVGPADETPAALDALGQLMQPLSVTPDEIATELKILAQERALEASYLPFVESAWANLLDPGVETIAGDLAKLAEVTPEQLLEAQTKLFAAGGLSLFVGGQLEPEAVAIRAEELLTSAPPGGSPFEPRGILESIGRRGEVDGSGAARAVLSAGLDRPMTLARIGTALALDQALGGIRVIYEPSFDRGPIVMYAAKSDSLQKLRDFTEADVARIAPVARLMAARWASGLVVPGPSYSVLKAKLLRQQPAFSLNGLRDTALGLTDAEIWDALRDWQGGAMHIEGNR